LLENSVYIPIPSVRIECYLSKSNARKLLGLDSLKTISFSSNSYSKIHRETLEILKSDGIKVYVLKKSPGRQRKLGPFKQLEINELYLSGLSIRKISSLLGISRGLVWRTTRLPSKPLNPG